jgi:hypothetical protein
MAPESKCLGKYFSRLPCCAENPRCPIPPGQFGRTSLRRASASKVASTFDPNRPPASLHFALASPRTFGGVGYNADTTNLAELNGGSNTGGQQGVYGTLGVPASSNIPGSRLSGVTWTDAKGNLWLLGGENISGLFSDLWVYQP